MMLPTVCLPIHTHPDKNATAASATLVNCQRGCAYGQLDFAMALAAKAAPAVTTKRLALGQTGGVGSEVPIRLRRRRRPWGGGAEGERAGRMCVQCTRTQSMVNDNGAAVAAALAWLGMAELARSLSRLVSPRVS